MTLYISLGLDTLQQNSASRHLQRAGQLLRWAAKR